MSMRGLILGGVVAIGLGGMFGGTAMARDFDRRADDHRDVWRHDRDDREDRDDRDDRYVVVRDDGHDWDRVERHEFEHHDDGRDRHDAVMHDRR